MDLLCSDIKLIIFDCSVIHNYHTLCILKRVSTEFNHIINCSDLHLKSSLRNFFIINRVFKNWSRFYKKKRYKNSWAKNSNRCGEDVIIFCHFNT